MSADLIAALREVGISQQHIDSDFARSTLAAGACRRAADLLEALTMQSRPDESFGVSQDETASLLSRLKEAERELANLREWRWSFDPLTLTHAMVVGLLAEVNDNDAGRDLAETLEAVRDNLTVAARDLQAAKAQIKVLEGALERLTGAVEWMREADDLPSPPATAEMLRSAWRSVGEAATAARSALPQLGGENG